MGPSSIGVGIGNSTPGKYNLKHRNDSCEVANDCAANGASGDILFFPDLEQRIAGANRRKLEGLASHVLLSLGISRVLSNRNENGHRDLVEFAKAWYDEDMMAPEMACRMFIERVESLLVEAEPVAFVRDGRVYLWTVFEAEPDLETKLRVADVFGEVFDTYPDIHYDFLMLTRDEFRQRERAVARIQG